MQVATTNDYSITPSSTTIETPLEPSKSSTTLAQRRRIPESAEKLKLTADHLDNSNNTDSSTSPTDKSHYTLFDHDSVSSTCTKVRNPIGPFYSSVSFLLLLLFFFSYPPFVYSSFSSVSSSVSSSLPPYPLILPTFQNRTWPTNPLHFYSRFVTTSFYRTWKDNKGSYHN